jgi:hypothetical protein
LIFNLGGPGVTMFHRSAMLLPIAASGGFLVHLDWPALTPAPIEIKVFPLSSWLGFAGRACCCAETSGLPLSWLFIHADRRTSC